ncbi:aspartic peptidase domain-containing protein [Mycena pura]|uniref:Aspartic peptidase domain-containing protein n=1 Tax=Mycena pura TaxID=153505 RepID=A0AAD6UZS6_9AGAR|nr:aspartic peptidase domain-containing protein [Mycena pura]
MLRLATSFLLVACLFSGTLSTPVAAPNVITVPISKKVSGKTRSLKALLARDLGRFNPDAAAAVGEAPATNEDDTYVVATKVGSQTFDLIVDTGSSNTWVGSGTKYSPGSTSTNTRKSFSVSYGSGSVSGTEFTDTVAFGGLTVTKQSIGDGTTSSGFDGVDGIIGFGPVDLTEETVSGSTTVPTVMDNLLSQGKISTEVLGVSFAPESGSDEDDTNGELTLGGTDATKFSGSITFVPKSTTSPYSEFWGVTVSSTTFNGKSIGGSASAIVDTGTTLIFIPTAAYNAFLSASGGTTDESTGLASWRTAPTANFAFTIGGVSFTLTPAQYLVPASQLADFGLPSGNFGWIADGGSTAADINFIIGQKFLENYYSVFDTTNKRVGFATRA